MQTNPLFADVAELLPHADPMILIDKVVSYGDGFLEALVEHEKPSLFADSQGNIPVWVGIEYMAQAIGAYAGIQSLQDNRPIRLGFLLGTRKYKAYTQQFNKNCPVNIRIDEIYRDESNLALFDCTIKAEKVLATAQIKAIQPDNLEEILRGS
jgi:predicted hotdog family 3-hydroxylacyl-ACP dehydratase